MESIADLRRICQGTAKKDKSNWYMRHVSRFFSIYFTRFLLPTPVTPNQVSFVMIVTGVIATLFYLSASTFLFVIGATLLQFWYILDCMDGEVARYRSYQSQGTEVKDKTDLGITGMYYDMINHYIINLMVPSTLAFGVYRSTGWDGWILIGFAAGVGQTLMLAMSHAGSATMIMRLKKMSRIQIAQEQQPESAEGKKSFFHTAFSWLHYWMTYPTVMNLVLIAAILEVFVKDVSVRIGLLLFLAGGSLIVTSVIISRKISLRLIDSEFFNAFKSEVDVK